MTTESQLGADGGIQASERVAFKAVGVKKHYPGVKALDGVDLEGYAGSVLGSVARTEPGSQRLRSCWPASSR